MAVITHVATAMGATHVTAIQDMRAIPHAQISMSVQLAMVAVITHAAMPMADMNVAVIQDVMGVPHVQMSMSVL